MILRPTASRTGETVSETSSSSLPSLRRRCVSKWSMRSPRCSRPKDVRLFLEPIRGNDDGDRFADHLAGACSRTAAPPRCSNCVMMPFRSLLTIASSEDSTMALKSDGR